MTDTKPHPLVVALHVLLAYGLLTVTTPAAVQVVRPRLRSCRWLSLVAIVFAGGSGPTPGP